MAGLAKTVPFDDARMTVPNTVCAVIRRASVSLDIPARTAHIPSARTNALDVVVVLSFPASVMLVSWGMIARFVCAHVDVERMSIAMTAAVPAILDTLASFAISPCVRIIVMTTATALMEHVIASLDGPVVSALRKFAHLFAPCMERARMARADVWKGTTTDMIARSGSVRMIVLQTDIATMEHAFVERDGRARTALRKHAPMIACRAESASIFLACARSHGAELIVHSSCATSIAILTVIAIMARARAILSSSALIARFQFVRTIVLEAVFASTGHAGVNLDTAAKIVVSKHARMTVTNTGGVTTECVPASLSITDQSAMNTKKMYISQSTVL